MKIVIDIPDFIYKQILKKHVTKETIARIFSNGTPLPKRHGRLIDADILAEGFEDNYEFCEALNATPTIIEAERTDKE